MILSAEVMKEPNFSSIINFDIEGSTPTSAVISWHKDSEKPNLGFNTKTVPIIYLGNKIFQLNYHITAQEFWVKLNTESRTLRFDNLYNFKNLDDKPLYITPSNPSWFSINVPYCDEKQINIELFTPDGVKLEAWSHEDGSKIWENRSVEIIDYFGSPKLTHDLIVIPRYVRVPGGAWFNFYDIPVVYVRVSNLKNVILNDILKATLINEKDYEFSWGGYCQKNEE